MLAGSPLSQPRHAILSVVCPAAARIRQVDASSCAMRPAPSSGPERFEQCLAVANGGQPHSVAPHRVELPTPRASTLEPRSLAALLRGATVPPQCEPAV